VGHVADCASVPRGRNGSLASKPPAAIMSLAQNGTSGFPPLPKTSTAHLVSPTGEGCQTRRKLWNTQNMILQPRTGDHGTLDG
jgi:hypothetical protein